jgi:hypothetical protein
MNTVFAINKEQLFALNSSRNVEKLEEFGGVAAIATALNTNLRTGLGLSEKMTNYSYRTQM